MDNSCWGGLKMSNHIKMPRLSDTVLVSFNRESPTSDPILIVGRKRKNQSVEIINAFQGNEAVELYNRLTTVKKSEGVSNE